MTLALPMLDAPQPESDDAGLGALQTEHGCLPLRSLDVRSRISGLFVHTSVRQTFRNVFGKPLEATYIFPLPDRAAATRFRLTVAGRVIEGELKERGQAREEYDQALQQGHRAAIAEEERSGVFTMRVGNIPPDEEAVVELDLVGPLEVNDDEATYRFPLVVAPRYTPGAALAGPPVGDGVADDTDQVPDASRVTPPVLLPGFPNPVRLSLEVELDPAGLQTGLAGIRASLHSVIVAEQGPPWTVRLHPDERLNRDFILRFPVAARQVQSTLQVSPATANRPGVFALTLTPPTMETAQPRPREIVFVLDRSGSMSGWKMVAARRALGRMIDTLLDQDRFTVLAFDDMVEMPGGHEPVKRRGKKQASGEILLAGTNRNRWRVLEWLGKIDARGGTEMGPALHAARDCFSTATTDVDRVLVLVTDGQVTGEDGLLRAWRKAGVAAPRIFTLGIDQAVNAGFLHRLAALGGGVCDLVESEDRLDEALDRVHRLIGQPVLTDVRLELLDFDGVAESLAPSRIAGLYPGRPLIVFGRHLSEKPGVRLRVQALDAAGQPWSAEVASHAGPADALLNLWGRAKVRELEDCYAAEGMHNESLADRIVQVSLESKVLSRFTAYVAVDRSEVVNEGGRQHQVVQPVETPAGGDAAVLLGAIPTVSQDPAILGFIAFQRRSRSAGGRGMQVPYALPAPPDDVEYVDSMLQEFTDTACDFDVEVGSALPMDVDFERPTAAADQRWDVIEELTALRKARARKVDPVRLCETVAKLHQIVTQMRADAEQVSRDDFARLAEALEMLAAVLDKAGHATRADIAALVSECRQIADGWDVAETSVKNQQAPFLEAAARALEALNAASPRKRGAFWKK